MTPIPSRLDFRVSCLHTPHLLPLAWQLCAQKRHQCPHMASYLPDGLGVCSQVGHMGPSEQLAPTFIKLLSKQCSTRAAEAKSQFQTDLRQNRAFGSLSSASSSLDSASIFPKHAAFRNSHRTPKAKTFVLLYNPLAKHPFYFFTNSYYLDCYSLAASQLPLTPTEIKWGKQKQQIFFLQSLPHSLPRTHCSIPAPQSSLHPFWI